MEHSTREHDAKAPSLTPVLVDEGGLTLTTVNSFTHSMRGLAFDAVGNFLGEIIHSKNQSLNEPVALCFNSETLYTGIPGNRQLFAYDAPGVASGD